MLALLLACRNYDLPPVVESSPHYRYHARDSSQIPAGLMPWLEAHRTDVLTYLGVDSTEKQQVVDYYLFRDAADRDANSPCFLGSDCEGSGSIYTIAPVTEFELVHAYFTGLGNPPRLLQEGIGGVFSWAELPHTRLDKPPEWTAAATDNGEKGQIQDGGYLWALYLLRTYGVKRLVDYYAWADKTEDPALIDLQFREFWGMSMGSIWQVMTGTPGVLPRPSLAPVNPCRLPALPNNGSPTSMSFPGQLSYIPLAVPEQGALAITLDPTVSDGFVQDCARAESAQTLSAGSAGGRSMGLLRLVSGAYFIGFDVSRGQTLSSVAGDWITSTCDDSLATPLPGDVDKISVLVPRLGGGAVWYLRLASETQRQLTLTGPGDPTLPSVAICPDCSGLSCVPLSGAAVPMVGEAVVQVTAGSFASFPHQRVELTVQ